MSRILSYFFSSSEPYEGNEFVDSINRHTIFNCEIKYTGKDLNYIKLSNQAFNMYFILYSHPTWNSVSKQIEYRLRCSELFYPHCKTITDFAEAINNYHIEGQSSRDINLCKVENDKIKFFIKDDTYEITSKENYIQVKSI